MGDYASEILLKARKRRNIAETPPKIIFIWHFRLFYVRIILSAAIAVNHSDGENTYEKGDTVSFDALPDTYAHRLRLQA